MSREHEAASLDSLEGVYRRSLDQFLRVAAAMLGSREAARDAVQEGFAAAVAKRDHYAGTGTVEAWTWSVVLNTVRNHRRSLRRFGREQERPLERNGGPAEPDDELRAAIAALPERQREVVFLHYYADLDYEAIGAALGIRSGTVGATLNAARAAIRHALAQEVA
jgi:RNA polymerase sigma-70 factor (ECF subfamily)